MQETRRGATTSQQSTEWTYSLQWTADCVQWSLAARAPSRPLTHSPALGRGVASVVLTQCTRARRACADSASARNECCDTAIAGEARTVAEIGRRTPVLTVRVGSVEVVICDRGRCTSALASLSYCRMGVSYNTIVATTTVPRRVGAVGGGRTENPWNCSVRVVECYYDGIWYMVYIKAAVWAQFGLPDPRTLHFAPLTNTSKSSQTQSLVTTGTALHWLQHQPHSHCPVRHQSLQHPPL